MSTFVFVCMCVCLSVCPRGYLRNHMRDLYQLFVHVAYGRGAVALGRVTKSQGKGKILFFPY